MCRMENEENITMCKAVKKVVGNEKTQIRKSMESFSQEDTYELAENLAKGLLPGSIVCLDGELGTGKTVFAKGFAAGLGISDDITSPTFTIVQSYEGDLTFHHFDVYRISEIEEMEEIGYEEYFFKDAVCLIEWASLIEELIPKDAIRVTIKKDLSKGLDYRLIQIQRDIK